MDCTALKTEIDNDPLNLGYKVEGVRKSNQDILALINDPTKVTHTRRTPNGKTPIFVILNYLAGCESGVLANLKDLEDDKTKPGQARSAAIAFNTWIRGASETGNFDLDSPQVRGAMYLFVLSGAITQPEVDGLLLTADMPVSRASFLFGNDVTLEDLERSN